MGGQSLRAAAVTALIGGAAAAGCADLEDIELGRCGNRVLDAAEDCDGHGLGASPCASPGEAHACRYTCDYEGGTVACPPGFRCGVEDVCTKPSNQLELLESPLLARSGDVLAAADFDGDRRADLAIASADAPELVVTFLSGLEVVAEDVIAVTPTRTLAVGRIDGDERPDIALGAEAALVSVGSAAGGRQLVSTAFAPYTFNTTVARVVAAPAQASLYAGGNPQAQLEPDADTESVVIDVGGAGYFFLRNPYDGTTPQAGVLPALSTHVETRRGAIFARPPGSPACDEVAFAFAAPARVVVVPLCDLCGSPLAVETPPVGCDPLPAGQVEVVLPGGGDVVGMWTAEVVEDDGTSDPGLELLVAVARGGVIEIDVVEEGAPQSVTVRTDALPEIGALLGGATPLDIRDLNADGALDVISSRALYASKPGGHYEAAVPSSARWDEVAVADFDGDGRLDVAAARRGPPVDADDDLSGAAMTGLDVLIGTSTSYFNPSTLATAGKAAVLGSGDFDGDGLADLALRERAVDRPGERLPSCAEFDDLAVLYGSAAGLSQREVVARLSGIEDVATGRLPRLDKRDGISDFGVVSQCLEGGDPATPDQARVTVFYGATNRQIVAPYLLNDERGDAGAAELLLLPHRPDAIATYELADARVVAAASSWLSNFTPAAPIEPAPYAMSLFVLETREGVVFKDAHFVPLFAAPPARALVAVGNVDADAEAEVLASSGSEIVVVDSYRCFPSSFEDAIVSPASGCPAAGTAGLREALVRTFTPPVADVRRLSVRDLDRDGLDDVVVMGAASASGPPSAAVLFGEATFTGSASVSLPLTAPEGHVFAAAFLPIYPAAGAPADGGRLPERLVLVVREGPVVRLHAFTLEGRAVTGAEVLATLDDASDVAVADLDGDGFEDVGVLTPAGVRLLRRLPTLAGDLVAP